MAHVIFFISASCVYKPFTKIGSFGFSRSMKLRFFRKKAMLCHFLRALSLIYQYLCVHLPDLLMKHFKKPNERN